MSVDLTTTTGRPISVAAGIRLPIRTYLKAKDQAEREGVKLNRLLCDFIEEGLEGSDQGREGKDSD